MADVVKKLPHKDWEEIRDEWINHLPQIDFDTRFPEPTIWDLPEAREILGNPSAEMAYVPGTCESVFREAVLLSRKFTYCRKASWEANYQGFPTWSVISAYDACFFGAKAICCFLGIVSLGRDSKWYVDVLAFQMKKIGGKKEKIQVLRAYDLKDRWTHDLLWRMTSRLLRTLTLPDSQSALLDDIDFDSVSNLRNSVIYNGGFWINHRELEFCDLVKRLSDLATIECVKAGQAIDQISHRYFDLAERLGRILFFFLKDISELAPRFAQETAAISQWRTEALSKI